jgi:hypothetical protein
MILEPIRDTPIIPNPNHCPEIPALITCAGGSGR